MKRGCIPTRLLREAIPKGMTNRDLAIRCNVKEDSLAASLERDEIEFDLADLILCRLHKPQAWYVEPLDEFYWMVELPDHTCQHVGCTEILTPPATGGNMPRYCSVKHRSAARRQREYATR